jgi:cysteine desulfurase
MSGLKFYFDYNATTPIDPVVSDLMAEVAQEYFGNPSSSHCFGRTAAGLVLQARQQVADLLRADSAEINFTSGGTESDNLALKGVVLPLLCRGLKPHVIVSAVEHPAILESCLFLERAGAEITRLSVAADGTLEPDQVAAAIRPETVLVSLMLANNETGVIFPLDKVSAITRDRGILLHTDAVQALGKVPIDVSDLGVDLLSLSGHKVYGPKGIGALWLRSGVELEPLLHGGGQESGLRSGTENLIGIAALGCACELLRKNMGEEGVRIERLRNEIEAGLADALGGQLIFHGHRQLRVPNTISLSVPYLDGEALLAHLDMEGIAVSAGSACSSAEHQGSPVLRAMCVDPDLTQGSLRISLGRWTAVDEINTFLEKFTTIVRRLWAISPLYLSRKDSR